MSKKWIKASMVSTLILGLGLNLSLFNLNNQNRLDLNVSANDKFNEEKGIDKIDLRQASSGEGVSNSKIFAQYAQNDAGQYFLRFATAVSGDLESITYDFDILETDGLDFKGHGISTVYSSLASGDNEVYYNGTELVNEKTEETLDWYWATFVVEFGLESPFLESNFQVNININGAKVEERQTSLTEVIDLSTEKAIDVYFIAGQSNASGCSDYLRSDNATPNLSFENQKKMAEHAAGYDDVLYYGNAHSSKGSSYGQIISTLIPTRAGLGVNKGREIGPELGMAEYLAERYEGTKRKALIIKYGATSSGLLSDTGCFGEWSAPSYPNPNLGTQQNLFNNMMGTSSKSYHNGVVYKALKAVKEAGFNKVDYKGFFWLQGGGDKDNPEYFAEATKAIIGDFRASINNISNTLSSEYENFSLSDASKLPFLLEEVPASAYGAYTTEDNMSSDEGLNAIIESQRNVAASDVNAETLTTYMYDIEEDLTGYESKVNDGISYCADKWHINADQMLDSGRRAASMLYTFKVDEGACQHQFGEYIVTEEEHKQICSLCNDYVREKHSYVHSFDGDYHFEQCETCKNIINKEPHAISELEAVSTKQYTWKDELDETAFEVYASSCSCGFGDTNVTDYEVTFNTEYADYNTIATITAGGASTSVKLDVNVPFGRQIEYNAENGITDSYASKLLNRQIVIRDSSITAYTGDGTTGGAPSVNELCLLKNMTSDGEYIYALVNYNASVKVSSAYNLGVLVKINTKGEVVDYTPNSYYWGTTGTRVGYLNGSLIVYNTTDGKKDGKIVAYSGNAKNLVGKQLEFDPETLELKNDNYSLISNFDKYPEGYTAIEQFTATKDSSKAVVVYTVTAGDTTTRQLYTYERGVDGKYYYVSSSSEGIGEWQGIYATNDYIYVNAKDGSVVSFMVYDWNINKLGEISSASELDVAEENKYYKYNSNSIGTDSGSNVRTQSHPYGCVVIDGVLYYGRGNWKNAQDALSSSKCYKGTYLYRIDLK